MVTKKGAKAKQAMLAAAIKLLDEKGYFGTSTNEILSLSGAPRGSLYYHFPGGKDEIVIAAIEQVGAETAALLDQVYGTVASPEEAAKQLFGFFSQRLIDSDFACGCPISAVALECSGKGSLIGATCAEVYKDWEAQLFAYLKTTGTRDEETAKETASLLFSLLEGALLLARTTADITPMETALKGCMRMLAVSD